MNFKQNRIAIFVASVISIAALNGCNSSESSTSGSPTKPSQPKVTKVSLPASININEPEIGKTEQAFVTVKLDKALSTDLPIKVMTTDGTAISTGQLANYQNANNSLTIAAGETELKVPVTVLRNELYEGDTQFKISIEVNETSTLKIENGETKVTIRDKDTTPEVNLRQTQLTLVEGDTAPVTLELSNYSSQEITVQSTITGLATSVDYSTTLPSTTFKIPPKTKSFTFDIEAIADGLPEGGESIQFDISSSRFATVGSQNSLFILIPGSYGLNDTGVSTYYNGSIYTSTDPSSEYPNQDASYGNDTLNPEMEQADGDQGFIFSKIDMNGNTLPSSSRHWSCVRDERTGLYYENKDTAQPVLNEAASQIELAITEWEKDGKKTQFPYQNYSDNWRSSSYMYTWYNKNSNLNGGNKGADNDTIEKPVDKDYPISAECSYMTNENISALCNTSDYLDVMNTYAVCGIDDWRLPSPGELREIYNHNSKIDPSATDYFETLKQGGAQTHYLTNQTSANKDGSVWCLDMTNGKLELCIKGATTGVIAVSEGAQL